jgi:hypothetical protein
MTDVSAHVDPPAAHPRANAIAGVAVNQQLTAAGAGTNAVNVPKIAFDVQSIRALALDREEVAKRRAARAHEDR